MSTSKEFLNYVLEQLSDVPGVSARPMMGEYLVYHEGKLSALICDDRLLVKPVEAARALLPEAPMEPPYAGAKDMILVEDVDDREKLTRLFLEMWPQLPLPKPKKKKN